MEEKYRKEHFIRTRKLLETKVFSRNLIKEINACIVSGIILWTEEKRSSET